MMPIRALEYELSYFTQTGAANLGKIQQTQQHKRFREFRTSVPSAASANILAVCRTQGGLMVSALDSGVSGPSSSPGRRHCVVFLGKTLHSHSASLHPGV